MRERRSVGINRLTGEQVTTTELLPDASFAERFAAMRAGAELSMLGHGPVEQRKASVRCDGPGCRAVAEVDYERPELPPGWVTDEAGEFCPACQ